ncbi:MAG TPA: diguanylate cyclase [Candidatus Limnocylindria bacterium]|nr:diguanylate cyclase [Candidatus Limnocylindria bacterium]
MERLRALDRRSRRGLPLAVRLLVPLLTVAVLTGLGFLIVIGQVISAHVTGDYTAEARGIAAIVKAQYEAQGEDRAALNAFVGDLVRFNPSVRHVHVYRLVSGVPSLWAANDPSAHAGRPPDPADVEPLASGKSVQRIVTEDGEPLLETILLVPAGGSNDATIGVYVSLEALDATVADVTRLVVATAAILVLFAAVAGTVIIQRLILGPIGRLDRAALRVASGDLTVRLPQGTEPPARDELARVARGFDHMVRALAEQRAEIERLAVTDGLTGLLNRRSFDEHLALEIDRAIRLRYALTVALVDLDGFKKLNDSQGHLAGDEALRRVAAALKSAVRGSDVLARYGGDEFAVIQPGCDAGVAGDVAARIRDAVARLELPADPATGLLLAASVGAAPLRPGRSTPDIVRAADAALYRAKARGGGVEIAADPG